MAYKNITSKDTLIVLTFAKAGLGHLRVAYALMEGLPSEAKSVLFSSRDGATTFLHRLTSVNPVMRELGEVMQYGLFEDIFTALYTRHLRRKATKLLPQVEATLNSLKPKPKKVVFISTHFGLAHQLAELKDDLDKQAQVEVKLVVVVTDDSPQHPWFVPQADLTIVPSKMTKSRLAKYAKQSRAHPSLRRGTRAKPADERRGKIETAHYPLSPKLGQKLTLSKFKFRLKQANPKSEATIKMSLPVSGAAVGLSFYAHLASKLHSLDSRFRFYITSRESAYTKPFLSQISAKESAKVFKYPYDRDVVSNYNKMIGAETISYEVTKPSEQAFKALYTPKQQGGVVLLFTHPVGRQEYDNLWYLARNKLIPSKVDQEELWQKAINGKQADKVLLKKAKNWRGVRLMHGSEKSALFIKWCLREGIFKAMMNFGKKDKSAGVKTAWSLVDDIL